MAIGALGGALIGAGAGGALSGIANLFSNDDAGVEAIKRGIALIQAVRSPNFDFSELTPAELQFVAQVDPVLYDAKVPEDVRLVAESAFRGNQAGAIAGMEDVSRSGLTMADKLASSQLMDQAAKGDLELQNSIMQNLAMRGRLGGGNEISARLLGGQGVSALRGDIARSLMQQALDRRLGALRDVGSMSAQARGQDLSRGAQNATMLNNFNQYVANTLNEASRFNALSQMEAANRNASERQRISDANALMRYSTEEANLNRRNTLQQTLRDFELRRAMAAAGGYGNIANLQQAQNAAQAQNISAIGQGLGMGLGGLIAGGLGAGDMTAESQRRTADLQRQNEMDQLYNRNSNLAQQNTM